MRYSDFNWRLELLAPIYAIISGTISPITSAAAARAVPSLVFSTNPSRGRHLNTEHLLLLFVVVYQLQGNCGRTVARARRLRRCRYLRAGTLLAYSEGADCDVTVNAIAH